MLLVPAVGLKIGSTGYKFVRYYTGKREYVAEGPPPTLLRMLGPIVVISTLGLFATGVGLAILGPGGGIVLGLHKASFVVVARRHGPARPRAPEARLGARLRRAPRRRLGGSGWRAGLVASAIVARCDARNRDAAADLAVGRLDARLAAGAEPRRRSSRSQARPRRMCRCASWSSRTSRSSPGCLRAGCARKATRPTSRATGEEALWMASAGRLRRDRARRDAAGPATASRSAARCAPTGSGRRC